jgi:hypothetical protein
MKQLKNKFYFAKATQWLGDHESLQKVTELIGKNIGMMEDENGVDLDLQVGNNEVKVRLYDWILRDNEGNVKAISDIIFNELYLNNF